MCGCHPGDCHYINGNYKARRRVALLHEVLTRFGIEQDRLWLRWVAASEGNMVSLTYTLEWGYGSHIVVEGAGFLLQQAVGLAVAHEVAVAVAIVVVVGPRRGAAGAEGLGAAGAATGAAGAGIETGAPAGNCCT